MKNEESSLIFTLLLFLSLNTICSLTQFPPFNNLNTLNQNNFEYLQGVLNNMQIFNNLNTLGNLKDLNNFNTNNNILGQIQNFQNVPQGSNVYQMLLLRMLLQGSNNNAWNNNFLDNMIALSKLNGNNNNMNDKLITVRNLNVDAIKSNLTQVLPQSNSNSKITQDNKQITILKHKKSNDDVSNRIKNEIKELKELTAEATKVIKPITENKLSEIKPDLENKVNIQNDTKKNLRGKNGPEYLIKNILAEDEVNESKSEFEDKFEYLLDKLNILNKINEFK